MARSGLRWNEMGVFSLATNYLACVDYIKYLQNHMNTFQNEILALCPAAAMPIMKKKSTSLGLLKAIATLQLIVYIIAVGLKFDCILESE